jgi:hypothetical protein
MRLSIPLALWALILAAPLSGAAQTSGPPIARLVARYDSAWNRRDSLVVNRLLAPNYQYFSSRGSVSSRMETMKFLSDPGYRLERAERSEVVVTLSGPVAVVNSRWQGQGTYQGERFVDDQRCGQTWVRSNDNWQLLNEHCVQIVKD